MFAMLFLVAVGAIFLYVRGVDRKDEAMNAASSSNLSIATALNKRLDEKFKEIDDILASQSLRINEASRAPAETKMSLGSQDKPLLVELIHRYPPDLKPKTKPKNRRTSWQRR